MRTVEDHDDLTVLDALQSSASSGGAMFRLASTLVSAVLIAVLAWQAAGLTWLTAAPADSDQTARTDARSPRCTDRRSLGGTT